MNVSQEILQEFYDAGFVALPICWDAGNKDASKYPEHDPAKIDMTIGYAAGLLKNGFSNANGVAVKLFPPNGMIDFDIKNTSNKDVYRKWFNIIINTNADILDKCCIERTRNDGYHVYIKYSKLTEKIPLARSDKGKEVVSLYTGGLLAFCYPTPGYEIVHGDMASVQDLTAQEFDLLIATAAMFHEDTETVSGQTLQLIDYPPEHETHCLLLDRHITDDAFETLLNSIDLYRSGDFTRKHWVPFLRRGSLTKFSAKVYFKAKRVLIFSASMPRFPNWHDSAHSGDTRWTLSPSKIIYYKNDRNWAAAIEEIRMICDALGIVADDPTPKTIDRFKFPYDIFPESIQDYIFSQVLQHEYLAGGILSALSTCIGNSCVLEAMDGYIVKPILYMAIVAPPGASKTPALKKAFTVLQDFDDAQYKTYESKLGEYKQQLASYEKDKRQAEKPEKPHFPQSIIKDSTIEMVIKILSLNPDGCCVYADELSGFMKRMNQYKDGDEVQKWLELWSGDPILLQRMSRDENKVQNPFCSIIGGIQPGVLEELSKEENAHNGFYHRFLFVFPEPWAKVDWQPIQIPLRTKLYFNNVFEVLIRDRYKKTVYRMSKRADIVYRDWFNNKNAKYNRANNDHIKGIIAKYQDYCLRLALILQVLYDGDNRQGVLHSVNVERSIQLTEYFFANMNKALKTLMPQTAADTLSRPYNNIYEEIPDAFTVKNILPVLKKYNIGEGAFKMWLTRNKMLFSKIGRGSYEKNL